MELVKGGHSICSVDDWFRHAPPRGGRYQWQDGYSAKELAKAWCTVPGTAAVPDDFVELLERIPGHLPIRPVSGCPEHRVRFDGLPGEPRNADLVLRCESAVGTVAVSVEAKSRETFGEPVHEVISEAARKWSEEIASNYLLRLDALYRGLFSRRRPGAPTFGELRYQLLTATAGALVFAAEIGAATAILVVHEFRPPNVPPDRFADNARDLFRFVHRLGGQAPMADADVFGPFEVPGGDMLPVGMPLYIAKLESACDAVQRPPRPRRQDQDIEA